MNAGRVLNHENLPHRVCVPTNLSRLRMIYTRLKRLRIKRGDDASDPRYIFAVLRVGYRMAKAKEPGPETA